MTKIIEANNLNKYLGIKKSDHIIKNLDLTIERNKLTAITGKSGSGKSSLLYLLSTLDTDFEGEILVNGLNISNRSNRWLSDYRNRNIGFIFQSHFLLPEFSVLDNVILPAIKLGDLSKKEIDQQGVKLLVMLGLEDHMSKKASTLSGGQKQRAAIARALINNPAIIMGDEPTGNLDAENTQIVLKFFKKLISDGEQTILVITHDNDFASKSDVMIQMRDGAII